MALAGERSEPVEAQRLLNLARFMTEVECKIPLSERIRMA
jgi:hypothetical protein